MTNEFVIALENLDTIEDALKYIPANKELVELRYLEDIAIYR